MPLKVHIPDKSDAEDFRGLTAATATAPETTHKIGTKNQRWTSVQKKRARLILYVEKETQIYWVGNTMLIMKTSVVLADRFAVAALKKPTNGASIVAANK